MSPAAHNEPRDTGEADSDIAVLFNGAGRLVYSAILSSNPCRKVSLMLQFAMKKSAAPRFIKMWDKLSPAAREVITQSLPSTYTRQVSKVPLGVGAEGFVFPSVTGSVGDSAVKYFPNLRPSLYPGELIPKHRGLAMQQRPDVFPRIHGTNPRGFTMERLTELPKDVIDDLGALSTNLPLRHARALHKNRIYERIRNEGDYKLVKDTSDPRVIIRRHREALNNLGGLQHILKRRGMRNTLNNLESIYSEAFATRPKDKLKLQTPEGRKFRRMQNSTPWNSTTDNPLGEPKVTHPVTGNPISVTDVAIHRLPPVSKVDSDRLLPHNIMRGSDGRIVFSDPIFDHDV